MPIRWPLPQNWLFLTPHLPALPWTSQCIPEKPQEKGHPRLSSVPFTACASSPFSGLSGSLLGPVAPGQHYAPAPPLISVWSLLFRQGPQGPKVGPHPILLLQHLILRPLLTLLGIAILLGGPSLGFLGKRERPTVKRAENLLAGPS